MTIAHLEVYAKYNTYVNQEMNKIISQLTPTQWEQNLGGFFKNIKSVCSHIYVGDFNWLKRFGKLRAFNYLSHPVLNQTYGWDSAPFHTIDEYIHKRQELDAVIDSFVDEIMAKDLDQSLQYKNWKGEEQDRNFGGLLIHFFNHQTHHRGGISLYLEMLGKENDFSNLLVIV